MHKSVLRGAGVDIHAKYVRCYPAYVIGLRVNPTNYTRPFAKLIAARSTAKQLSSYLATKTLPNKSCRSQ